MLNQKLDWLWKMMLSMRPYKKSMFPTRIEKYCSRLDRAVAISLVLSVLFMGVLVLSKYIFPAYTQLFRVIAMMIIGFITIVNVLFLLIKPFVLFFETFFSFRRDDLRHFCLERRYDLAYIADLVSVDSRVLEEAQRWLALKIEREHNWISLFCGSPSKVSFLSLMVGVPGVWVTLKNLPTTVVAQFDIYRLLETAFIVGLTATASGIALAALFSIAAITRRHRYHQELLALAIHYQQNNLPVARVYIVPRPYLIKRFLIKARKYIAQSLCHVHLFIKQYFLG